MVYFQYLLCASVIVLAGVQLAKHGDVIGAKTGVGRTWVGLVMLATVTSLPELAIGISSVAIHDLPDIAAGDIFGSCLFNLLILAVLECFSRDRRLFSRLDIQHSLSAAFGIMMLAIFAVSMISPVRFTVGFVDGTSLLVLALYLFAMRLAYMVEKRSDDQHEPGLYQERSLRKSLLLYGLFASFVVAAGMWLPSIAEEIAGLTGMESGFVGTTFVALSTSLPELVITLGAIKLGAFDMAAANIFGSNLFNMLVLSVDDFFYRSGSLFDAISEAHMVTILGVIAMGAISIAALSYRTEKKSRFVSIEALALVVVFLVTVFLSHASSGSSSTRSAVSASPVDPAG